MAIWPDKIDAIGAKNGSHIQANIAMFVNAVCPSVHSPDMDATPEMNRHWLGQVAEIGAASLAVIAVRLPEGKTYLFAVRDRALKGSHRWIKSAHASGVWLAIEPFHVRVCGVCSFFHLPGGRCAKHRCCFWAHR